VRAAIYVRQSVDKTGESLAVTRQEAECRQLAERQSWDIARTYRDNDKSATRGPRPAWRELLRDVAAGQVTVVVAWHTDRLYRRVRDQLDLMEAGLTYGLRIETVTAGSIDLATPAGRMIATQLASVAGYEGEQKSARQRSANLQRAQHGVIRWTRRPYGYTLGDDGRIAIVEAEADVIRDAATRVLNGASTASVVKGINGAGATTSVGKPWTVTALRRVLINPRTHGRAVSKGVDFGRGTWPAILDPDTADRLTALFTGADRRTSPPNLAVKYLLSGLALCGKCGKPMYASPTHEGPVVYRCKTTHLARRLDLVDEVVIATIVGRLAQPDAIDLLSPDVDLDALRAQVVELRDRRDGLASLLADGLLTAAAVREQASKLTDSIGELEREILAATGDGPLATLLGADDVADVWKGLTLTAKRAVINVLMTVTIKPSGKGQRFNPKQIDVEWRSS
jgi:site-specific DNA recombinase